MYDIAGLIAPRPLFAESGEKDPIFPVEASRDSFSRVAKMYEIFQAPDHFATEIFPDEHSFYGHAGLPFLRKHLS